MKLAVLDAPATVAERVSVAFVATADVVMWKATELARAGRLTVEG